MAIAPRDAVLRAVGRLPAYMPVGTNFTAAAATTRSPFHARSRMTTGIRKASTVSHSHVTGNEKERVVILGSGWAGYAFAKDLDPRKYERVMISPRSYFVFTPLVASTAVGTLEFRAALESVRKLGLDHFHQGWADKVDFSKKVIRVEANFSDDLASKTQHGQLPADAKNTKGEMFDVPYDKLVIAVGSYSQTFGIEGVRQYANFLRDVSDARRVREKVLQCFEKATLPTTTDKERQKLLHFVVVGGGPTGIEYAAELHDLISEDLSKVYPDLLKFCNITVYDIAPKVLPMFDQKLAKYAMDTFAREGIQVKTEHHLTRIRPDEDCDGCLKLRIKEYGDEEVGAGVVVWSTGLMQNPLLEKIEAQTFFPPTEARDGQPGSEVQIQKDSRTGGIIVDQHMRVTVVPSESEQASDVDLSKRATILPDVYALGDCAVSATNKLPATAQVASQEAAFLAKHLNKGNLEQNAFVFKNLGVMAYLGSRKAIHQSSIDDLKGWAAWILWRTAYLTRSMSIRNKIMILVYWAKSWFFGRDISRF